MPQRWRREVGPLALARRARQAAGYLLGGREAGATRGPRPRVRGGVGGAPAVRHFPTLLALVAVPQTVAPVVISADSSLSASGPFTSATKILTPGVSLTLRFTTSPSLAHTTVGIWIAIKGADGTWSAYKPHASVTTDGAGVATYTYTTTSRVWLAFRARYGGDASHTPAWSYPSLFGRWI